MCNIIVCNLNNESLNKKAFLILGTLGSPVHSDGWGVSTSKGFFKSTVPMYLSSVAGQNIEKVPGGGHLGALIGHIRQASPLIPINLENCHPFVSPENNIIFDFHLFLAYMKKTLKSYLSNRSALRPPSEGTI